MTNEEIRFKLELTNLKTDYLQQGSNLELFSNFFIRASNFERYFAIMISIVSSRLWGASSSCSTGRTDVGVSSEAGL